MPSGVSPHFSQDRAILAERIWIASAFSSRRQRLSPHGVSWLLPAPRSDLIEAYHGIGHYAGRSFKGAAPADLPVHLPKIYELTINLNVVPMPPDRGEICSLQFIRSPD